MAMEVPDLTSCGGIDEGLRYDDCKYSLGMLYSSTRSGKISQQVNSDVSDPPNPRDGDMSEMSALTLQILPDRPPAGRTIPITIPIRQIGHGVHPLFQRDRIKLGADPKLPVDGLPGDTKVDQVEESFGVDGFEQLRSEFALAFFPSVELGQIDGYHYGIMASMWSAWFIFRV